jgi:hypothetical protein
MSDLERGLIQFYQACLPSLFPGEYTIKVDQTIQEIRPKKPFRNELDFSVAGPRFTLNPGDVYSVYPPVNHSGEFGNTLPQIVFTRRTLPWERTLDGKDPDSKSPCPWLALLVLSASDFKKEGKLPEIQTRKVEALLKPAAQDNCMGPDIKPADLKTYESLSDQCNTIDLPADLFVNIVPQSADLPYLAHVREVNTENKETLSYQSEGSFAVVLANRFPEPTAHNSACLVSLEGFQNHLCGEPKGSNEEANIRLAVLANWKFTCEGENNFKVLMHNLRTGRLCRSVSKDLKEKIVAKDNGANAVGEAFKLGYTALNHNIRNGEKTVSWYRGPLVPLSYNKAETYPFIPSADAALRYNYNTGLLDVSYAAAWQLGRMLALQNNHFAQALYRYRNKGRLKTKSAIRQSPANDAMENNVIQVFKSNQGGLQRLGRSART